MLHYLEKRKEKRAGDERKRDSESRFLLQINPDSVESRKGHGEKTVYEKRLKTFILKMGKYFRLGLNIHHGEELPGQQHPIL